MHRYRLIIIPILKNTRLIPPQTSSSSPLPPLIAPPPFIHSNRDRPRHPAHSQPPHNLRSPNLNPTAHNPFVQWTTSRRKTADPLARVSRVSQLPHVTPSEQLDTRLLITAAAVVISHWICVTELATRESYYIVHGVNWDDFFHTVAIKK